MRKMIPNINKINIVQKVTYLQDLGKRRKNLKLERGKILFFIPQKKRERKEKQIKYQTWLNC